MNVTFLEDHQSYRTGNTLYKRGDEATFARHGTWLVLNGVAKEGWDHKLQPEPEFVLEPTPAVDVSGLTVSELRELAKAADVSGYSKMKKAELIEALS
jgi:hypothetical protein